MQKTTRYSPDTCGCVLLLNWDTDHPEDEPVFGGVEKKCADHASLTSTDEEAHAYAWGDNRVKNRTRQAIMDRFGLTHEDMMIGKVDRFNWSFDSGRVMSCSITGLAITGANKTALDAIIEAFAGSGKVVIVG